MPISFEDLKQFYRQLFDGYLQGTYYTEQGTLNAMVDESPKRQPYLAWMKAWFGNDTVSANTQDEIHRYHQSSWWQRWWWRHLDVECRWQISSRGILLLSAGPADWAKESA